MLPPYKCITFREGGEMCRFLTSFSQAISFFSLLLIDAHNDEYTHIFEWGEVKRKTESVVGNCSHCPQEMTSFFYCDCFYIALFN